MKWRRRSCLILICSYIFFAGCKREKLEFPLFEVLNSKRTGLDFSNDLSYNQDFNLFKYLYFYNGSGVGAGDLNNDGLIDLFFGSNQQRNKLYVNTGDLHFKDVTNQSKIPDDGGWTTGISIVDINNDGLLDIYVCRVGKYETLKSNNQFLICQGIDRNGTPFYEDKAREFGLDFSGFSTQAAFFDYDQDGDLDMYLLNHSVHQTGSFRARYDVMGTYDSLSGDRLYRNDGNHFSDVTRQTGINSTVIGYGLGIAISDINLDGYPDIYVGNDFHENDYLYINQKNGTFTEEGAQRLMHTSRFTMGVDAADMNNDSYPEIISTDMLASDPYILKRSLGEDDYDVFNGKISMGYSYQYTRNNLQLNRRNGLFSEAGLYSGIAATDWSWSPLWVDFDNDGWKDLFISNGIPKRLNDIDYINFVSHSEMQQSINDNNVKEKDISLIKKFPEIKLPDKFYRNNTNLTFSDETARVEGSLPTFSNGAAYADLDNDGDLDIVVNNIDATAIVYQNQSTQPGKSSSLRVMLKGPESNRYAVGARVIVFAADQTRTYEKYPVKGFMSSMEIPLLIGLNKTKVDSMILIWPDNTFEPLTFDTSTQQMNISWKKGLKPYDFARLTDRYQNTTRKMFDITGTVDFNFVHHENKFIEFDREPLIPHMISTEGPALAVSDINHDGLEDVFVGSASSYKSAIFLQQVSGKFLKTLQPALEKDSAYEDVDACWTDVNNDNNIDLVIASGGNEFFGIYGKDTRNTPRVYLNDGKANFTKLPEAFGDLNLTASSVAPYDFNGDGYMDLFIGARAVCWEYGQVPASYFLENDKTGRFKDVTSKYLQGPGNIGFVTKAVWFDLDKDGDMDLMLSLEWGGISAFINEQGKFTKKELTNKKGWWNFMLPVDIDNDGDYDLIAGNLGLNSRLKASVNEPVRLYYNDFDGNGKKEQILTYYLGGKEIPFANKAELEKQMPVLKKKFLYAADFAKATLQELFGLEKLDNANVLSVDYFSNAILLNKGNLEFEATPLPAEAQFSSFKDAAIIKANNDELPDILLAGNYYNNNIEMGRYDADFGTILVNKGNGSFECQEINGNPVKGQVRHIQQINIGKQPAYILARNSDSALVVRFSD